MAKKKDEFNLDSAIELVEQETVSIDDAAEEVGISGMYLRKLITTKIVTPTIKKVLGRKRILREDIPVITTQRAEQAAEKAAARDAAKALKEAAEAEKALKAAEFGITSYTLKELRNQSRALGLRISGRNKAELAQALEEHNAKQLLLEGTDGDDAVENFDLDLDTNVEGIEIDLPDVLS